MELYFLGTGAGMPSKERNVTAVALTLYDERGTMWLFDCGEGTQHQILRSPLKASRLEFIFITHLHGDHVYGLPGLLTSRSNQGGTTPLTLFGPPGLEAMLEPVLRYSQAHLSYELLYREVGEGVVFQDDRFEIQCSKLDHRIDSYGYRIVEKDKPGKLDAAKLHTQGIPPGPLFGKIKRGETVALPDGTVIDGKSFIGPPVPGKKIVILGDTRKCEAAVSLSSDADVLVHEATFDSSLDELAQMYYHSTAKDAAQTAKRAGAKSLILTHISSRYQEDEAARLLSEAQQLFPATWIAKDHWSFSIS
ncbi:ribonuclease Z [Paenibacillus hemerocallicola]|uniref:Ribonuclease Z n=1 Tax=Paenibacillus hemerocallicola TaxID=1172614 RepID=A0A5C4TI52_9BACL|nr:ribonuclease Z [Paenibacillus hemerocallicola]TNJ68150.1 ribonuclease Z [Paenibacillus hemerocallicola]